MTNGGFQGVNDRLYYSSRAYSRPKWDLPAMRTRAQISTWPPSSAMQLAGSLKNVIADSEVLVSRVKTIRATSSGNQPPSGILARFEAKEAPSTSRKRPLIAPPAD